MLLKDKDTALQLNESQQEAYSWDDGSLLVLAGPGSGKTTVLTERIVRLLVESPDERFRILALTFTQNAARNMQKRVNEAVEINSARTYISTFHSFCAEVIRQHGDTLDIKTDFSILNQDVDREELLLEVIDDLKNAGYEYEKEDIYYLPTINSVLEQDYVIEIEPIPDTDENKVKLLYYRYIEKMKHSGRIDYPGLIYFAIRLLEKKHIAKHYNIVYKYVCIDEYQDTNLAQFRLLSQLVEKDNPNLFVVADDDQILYQWRGASPERLQDLIDHFNMTIVQLPENYRCPVEVVNIANKMISNNRSRYGEKQPGISKVSEKTEDCIRVERFESIEYEIQWIADDIKSNKRTPTETKIMGRTRKLLITAQKLFEQNGISAVIHQRKAEFRTAPLKFLHSLLKLLANRGDKVKLQHLSSSFYQLEGINIDVHETIGHAPFTGGDLLKAWFELSRQRKGLSENTSKYFSLIDFDKAMVDYYQLIENTFTWIESFDQVDHQNPEIFNEYSEEKEIWYLLQKEIIDSGGESQTLSRFLQELDLYDKSEPLPPDAFELITIHGAKGLEFEHVYLIGMVNDMLPAYRSIKNGARPELLEEERRSCFVAITRTQKTLTMTYSDRYNNWSKEPSMFLYEMDLLEN
ncbi:MAG: ATP-dependent helicase [Spirochaetes bacterium]|nr:ATP-dependent helicase [Spirochaetota bacterium]MBN2770829.1 ATP-dependent helicase [Spirochaetota bacterium]